MELILKPTELCNFACTFCSSTNIAPEDDRNITLDLDYVFKFLKRFPNTNTIIINGGDPLMLDPSYYWRIIEHLEEHGYPSNLSFTSNLWPFLKKPEKWKELFRHPRVGVTTSFNYGDTRRITPTRVFTEEDFWEVSDAMLEHVGYRPDFISVITEDNIDTAIDNVLLAQRMDVECKLNYAMASGVQGKPFMLGKMYQVYVEVAKRGLAKWEFNTKQMVQRLIGGGTSCPQNRSCDEGIRAMNPGGDYYSCGSLADDKVYPIRFVDEVINNGPTQTPLQNDLLLDSMHSGCYACPNFLICNGCRKTIKDHKQHNMVEEHCGIMKSLITDIEDLQGLEVEPLERPRREYID